MSPRIKRVYIYHWRAGRGTSWDSALLSRAGTPRTAFDVFARQARLADPVRAEQLDEAAAEAPEQGSRRGVTLPLMRAGDSDRAAVVDLLRAHHLDGRLTVDEFEERVEHAHNAVTLLELGDLHEDLPELQPRRGKVVRRSSRPPRIPGRLAFVDRVELPGTLAVVRDQAFESIAPALARYGYKLSVAGDALIFRRERRPVWTVLVAVCAFPIGLLALLHTETEEIVVELERAPGGGTSVLAHGTGSLTVRRAFAHLRE